MDWTLLFFIFSNFYQHIACDSIFGKGVVTVEKFNQCPDKSEMANLFKDIVVNQVGFNKVRIYGKILVRQTIVSPATLKVVINKCVSKEEPDTCEYYYTYNTDKFCEMVGQKNMPWSDFWQQTTLPKSCPVNVGNYSINGANLDMNMMPSVPLLFGYWKTRSTGKSGGKPWHCAQVEFSIGPNAQKRKRGKGKE